MNNGTVELCQVQGASEKKSGVGVPARLAAGLTYSSIFFERSNAEIGIIQQSHSYFAIRSELEAGAFRLVDLRSPGEYSNGAMPGAINVPLFDDAQRAAVGTTYKQIGQKEAVQQGLEFLAEKIDAFVERLLELAGPNKKLAVHCWRGGMRSSAVAKLLEILGVEVFLLKGGYKTYRRQVLELLDCFANHRLLVLNGRTGSGKTALIRMLEKRGLPAIDFEGLACHRGSAIGDINIEQPQPTQQNFENQLANKYFEIKHHKIIIAESEQDLGSIRMPIAIRRHVFEAEMVFVEQTMKDRIDLLQKEYISEWGSAQETLFLDRMMMLKKHIQGPVYDKIVNHVKKREFPEAIELFLKHRYDACYEKSFLKHTKNVIKTISISEVGWDVAFKEIQSIVSAIV